MMKNELNIAVEEGVISCFKMTAPAMGFCKVIRIVTPRRIENIASVL